MHASRLVRALVAATAVLAVASAAPVAAAAPQARIATVAVPQLTCVAGAKACPIRITFASGAYSAQRSSTLTGISSRKWFVVHARAGQQMIVIVEGKGATRGVVHFPNGQQDGQPGGRVFDGNLPVSGDYKIDVTESSMAEAWSGKVTVVVVVF